MKYKMHTAVLNRFVFSWQGCVWLLKVSTHFVLIVRQFIWVDGDDVHIRVALFFTDLL